MPTFEWNGNTLSFETERMRGCLETAGKNHGIRQLVFGNCADLVRPNLFLFNLYRVLCRGQFLGVPRNFENEFLPVDDGVDVKFKATEEHQAEIMAQYRIREPNIIDLELTVSTRASYESYELYLSSYFAEGNTTHVYARKPNHHRESGGHWLQPFCNDVFSGAYLAYPRDEAAAMTRYDGRFSAEYAPVQWAIGSFYAQPLAVMRYPQFGMGAILMAQRETCFCLNGCYKTTGPGDSVAHHNSSYFSLFGEDLLPGVNSANARVRLVMTELDEALDGALESYEAFVKGEVLQANSM